MSERWLPDDKLDQRRLGQKITKTASSLTKRWKYDDRYFTGKIDPWMAAFTIDKADKATHDVFQRLDLNETNPFHWRALFETLLGEVVRKRGRPPEWVDKKLLVLAIDVHEVHEHKMQNGKGHSGIASALMNSEPYKSRYGSEDFGVLVKQVARVSKLMQPMDEESLVRLAKLYPDLFLDVFFERSEIDRRRPSAL
jgi:hypothetical protein